MRILIIERLAGPALESSSAMNNAGTGHGANCELNYTPLLSDGSISIEKALENFQKILIDEKGRGPQVMDYLNTLLN